MNILVPNTLNGAVLVSIIDFFLSFVVISFIGVVMAMLPLLNRLGSGVAANSQRETPPISVREAVDVSADDLAVISGAIAAIVGAHRIVHIEPAHAGGAWQSEVRAAHHSAHHVEPRPSPRAKVVARPFGQDRRQKTMHRKFRITVDGQQHDITVEELTYSSSLPYLTRDTPYIPSSPSSTPSLRIPPSGPVLLSTVPLTPMRWFALWVV